VLLPIAEFPRSGDRVLDSGWPGAYPCILAPALDLVAGWLRNASAPLIGRRHSAKGNPHPALIAILNQLRIGPIELSHCAPDPGVAAAALLHEAEIEQEIGH
jgi:hypothetical protein